MYSELKKLTPDLYTKLEPYFTYLENCGFYMKHSNKPSKKDGENLYDYFNGWRYKIMNDYEEQVVDLASYTNEPKIEIYIYKIKKVKKEDDDGGLLPIAYRKIKEELPYYLDCPRKKDKYNSVIVDNIKDFKKQINKFLKQVKNFRNKVKLHAVEKDFT